MPSIMNRLIATLHNTAIERAHAGLAPVSALYFWVMQRLGSPEETRESIDAFCSHLLHETNSAATDRERALRADSLSALFDPTVAARVGQSIARRRAALCVGAAETAMREWGLEGVISFSLAALAFDPGNGEAARHLAKAKDAMVVRCQGIDVTRPSLEGTLLLAVGAALGAADTQRLLLELLMQMGEFDCVMQLGERMERNSGSTFASRVDVMNRRRFAQHRLEGADEAEAQAKADADVREWLLALGSPEALEIDALRERVARCFGHVRQKLLLGDMRELRRRDPKDTWVPYNLCVILYDALHPDVEPALALALRSVGDDLSQLKTAYEMMWVIGAIPQALALAAKLSLRKPEYAEIGALHEMATNLDLRPAHVFGRARTGRRLLYANLTCWGEKFIDLMERSCLASLVAPGNIPALVEKIDVVVELFTMPRDAQRLRESPAVGLLAQHCEVRIYCFPEIVAERNASFKYATFGHGVHATALRAERDGADVSFLTPDCIYADGGFRSIAERVTSAPRAIFADGLNVYSDPILKRMQPHFENGRLVVSPQTLIDAAIGCATKRTHYSLYKPGDGQTCERPTRVIFPMEGGLRVHGFMMHPIYVSHAAFAPFVKKNFVTPDGMMLEHILNGVEEDQLEVLSSDKFCFVEIAEDDGVTYPIKDGDLVPTIHKFFKDFGLGRNRLRLFNRPLDILTSSPPDLPLVSPQEVEARVREVQEMFATDPFMVDLAEEQERVRQIHYRKKIAAAA